MKQNNYMNWFTGTALIIKVDVKAPRGKSPYRNWQLKQRLLP